MSDGDKRYISRPEPRVVQKESGRWMAISSSPEDELRLAVYADTEQAARERFEEVVDAAIRALTQPKAPYDWSRGRGTWAEKKG